MLTSVDVPVLLDAFAAVAAESDEQGILQRGVDLAGRFTRAHHAVALLPTAR